MLSLFDNFIFKPKSNIQKRKFPTSMRMKISSSVITFKFKCTRLFINQESSEKLAVMT